MIPFMDTYKFKRILVCLDITEIDETLLQASSVLTKYLEIDKIYFFHVVKSLELPEELTDKYPDLLAPVDESVEKLIEDKIDRSFESNGCPYDIDVAEGNSLDQILKWSRVKEIDLILVGRKKSGLGVLPESLVKVCHNSLLVVPENSRIDSEKILVPLDFSKNSIMTFHHAKELADKFKSELVCQHNYHVPSGYHLSGKSYEEFAKIMKGHAENDFKKFCEEMGFDHIINRCILSLDEDHDPATTSLGVAQAENVNLIVIGSKGRTGLSSILIGSVAMKMIKHGTEIPLLVVKDKKENLGFLDAILRL